MRADGKKDGAKYTAILEEKWLPKYTYILQSSPMFSGLFLKMKINNPFSSASQLCMTLCCSIVIIHQNNMTLKYYHDKL